MTIPSDSESRVLRGRARKSKLADPVYVQKVVGAGLALWAAFSLNVAHLMSDGDPLMRLLIAAALIGGGAFAAVSGYMSRFTTSRPDQWQILIREGQMVSAGVGATHFRGPFDTVVQFPSALQRVQFSVEQVTREVQGVAVSGFVAWSIHREGEGPWRAYRSLMLRDKDADGRVDDVDGNIAIKDLATSIIRVCVANTSLQDVLSQRDVMRDRVRAEMMQVLPGWGAWLETVEISDVRVCSKQLFEDLQAPHRALARRSMEEERMKHDVAIRRRKAEVAVEIEEADAKAATEKAAITTRTTLERDVQRMEAQLARTRKEKEILEEETKLTQAKALMRRAEQQMEDETEALRAVALAKRNAQLQLIAAEAEQAERVKDDERRRLITTPAELRALQVETLQRIYSALPLREVRVQSFVSGGGGGKGGGGGADVSSLLPGLATLAGGWQALSAGDGAVSD